MTRYLNIVFIGLYLVLAYIERLISTNFKVLSYILRFRHDQISEHCFYWIVFSTSIYRKVNFNSLQLFSYFGMSINCRSWVCKLRNIFLTCAEIEAVSIFEGF